jgi:hypothetical protein
VQIACGCGREVFIAAKRALLGHIQFSRS